VRSLFDDHDLVDVAGVDEAGRGPWAGPVMAAAAILTPSSAEVLRVPA